VAAAIIAGRSGYQEESYPPRPSFVQPTRLGNVLSRYESMLGAPYGIDIVVAAPRLAMVAGERELGYLDNQRTQLDLAVRTSFMALLATAATLVLTWRDGVWLLLALLPYGIAFLAYRGAIVVAHEHGISLAVLMEFNRFALYERLRLKPPQNSDEEQVLNSSLMDVFRSRESRRLVYEHPSPGSDEAATPDSSDGSARQ
jgi:hypothetical protein